MKAKKILASAMSVLVMGGAMPAVQLPAPVMTSFAEEEESDGRGYADGGGRDHGGRRGRGHRGIHDARAGSTTCSANEVCQLRGAITADDPIITRHCLSVGARSG